MNRKKRTFKPVSFFVTWILVLTLLVTMIPASAFATEVEETETTVEAVSTEESVVESAVAAETEAVIEAAEEIVSETEASATTEEVSTEEISTEETDIEEEVSSDDVSAEGESSILIEETDQTEEIVETVGETETEVETESETEVAYQAGTFTHTGKDYVITVSYDEEACLPEGTQLVVKELTERAADYESYYDKAEEAVASDENTEIKEIRLFDIAFEYEGEAVEPKAAVNVTIKAQYEETPASEDISVVHIPDEADTEVLASDCTVTSERDNDNSEVTAEFTSDSFSVYAVVVTTLETNYITADGASYKITVTFDEEAGIPADAELKVEEILKGTSDYDKYNEKALEELFGDDLTPELAESAEARYFDITIVSKGKKIEPKAAVEVKITYDDPLSIGEDEELQVVHFADKGTELIAPAVDGKDIIFEQSSFSVTGTIVAGLGNAQNLVVIAEHNGNYYEVRYDGSLKPVEFDGTTLSTGDTVQIDMAERWSRSGNTNYRLRVQNSGGYTYISPSAASGLSGTQTNLTYNNNLLSASVGGTTYYIGVNETATAITGGNSQADAAKIYFATVPTPTGNTVDHIDIGIEATARVSVPLAYGPYYDADGNLLFTVSKENPINGYGSNNNIPITQQDLMGSTVSSYTGDHVPLNNFVITSFTTSTGSGQAIDQVRYSGTFPVGTSASSADKVYYNVDVTKPVELTLTYDYDGDGDDDVLYDMDGQPLVVTVVTSLDASFDYWDDRNECPGILNSNQVSRWRNGEFVTGNGGGMDFRLGANSENEANLAAIEIVKYIVDEDGNTIELQSNAEIVFDFDIYQNPNGDVTAPTAWSGATTAAVDYSGYSTEDNRTVTVGSSGIGLAYDYDVVDGLTYIKEVEGDVPQTITDKDGNVREYVTTYIQTEYAWRNDNGTMHSNINQSDKMSAIPDVVGDYYSTDWDEDGDGTPDLLHNTFLEFYVYNVYASNKIEVTVEKVWDDADDQDGIRPDSVEVVLTGSDGNSYKATLDGTADTAPTGTAAAGYESSAWKATFINLPAKTSAGADITYTASETTTSVITGTDGPGTYAYAVTGTQANGYTVTNTHTPELTTKTITKVWDDADDQDGIRPESVEVTLTGNGSTYKVTLDGTADTAPTGTAAAGYESAAWTATFVNLPKYADGTEITYTYAETETAVITGTDGPGTYAYTWDDNTVTNKHTPEVTTATITKEWDDADDQDGIRPDSVEVTLTGSDGKNYSVTLDGTVDDEPTGTAPAGYESAEWTATFVNLPKYADGTEITYTTYAETTTSVITGTDGPGTYAYSWSGNTVTNKHTPEVTTATITKEWDDADDQDGIRPENVEVTLTGSDGKNYSVTLDGTADSAPTGTAAAGYESAAWTATFVNLPKYADGTEITYTTYAETETDVITGTDGPGTYAYSWSGNTVTNKHTPEVTTATIVKEWDDADDQDGIRPESVEVTLTGSDGKNYSVTLDGTADSEPTGTAAAGYESEAWTATFVNLPKYADGTEITYTTYAETETDVITGTDGPGTYAYSWEDNTVTNTHTPEVTTATIVKEWDDADDQDGIRPESVEVTLTGSDGKNYSVTLDGTVDDEPTGTEAAGYESAAWTATFVNLPKYADGTEITYTTYAETETDVITGTDGPGTYAYSWSGNTVTNKHTPEDTTETITKEWDDADDQDGIRPESVEVTLTGSDGNSYRVTLDGTADAEPTGTAPAGYESAAWTASFVNLPKYADGTEITYTYAETETTVITGTDGPGTYAYTWSDNTVTNTHTPETTEISGEKVWEDDKYQNISVETDYERPSVTITLNGSDGSSYEVTLDGTADTAPTGTDPVGYESDVWKFTFINLPKYYNKGTEIDYTVSEEDLAAFEEAVSGTTVTNTPEEKKTVNDTSITIFKVDGEGTGEVGLEGAVFTLTAEDGTETTYTTDSEGKVTITFDGYETEEDVDVAKTSTYTLKETTPPTGYELNTTEYTVTVEEELVSVKLNTNVWEWLYNLVAGVTPDFEDGVLTVENPPVKTQIKAIKDWEDDDDRDGKRPESVSFTLTGTAGSEEVFSDTQEVSESDDWSYTWKDLVTYYDGTEVTYELTEAEIDGYQADISEMEETEDGFKVTVTNTYTPETIDIPVEKVWDDADDQDGFRPASVTVTLMADGKAVSQEGITAEQTLDESNSWSYTWEGLYKYKDGGTEIAYTVEETETDVITGTDDAGTYAYEVVKNEDDSFTVTNKHTPERIEVEVEKEWDDADNQDGKRPDSITVNLLADGKNADTAELSEDNSWKYTFKDLDKYADGVEINYTVTEDAVEGYSTTYAANKYVIKVTNSYTPEETSLTVVKAWEDNGDQDGIRPDSVTVKLLADGTETGDTLVLNADCNWTGSFTKLPVYKEGKEIVYTIKEESVTGYVTTVTGDAKEGYVITNTHDPETTDITVNKTWVDNDNEKGLRPETITAIIYADGEKLTTMTLSEANGWTETLGGLPKYEDGKEIVYTVGEVKVEGYTSKVNGFDITNTLDEEEKVSFTVKKVWDDNKDEDGIRPGKIKVQLYANGKEYGSVVTLNKKGGWKYTWTDLPKTEDGKLIEYVVKELECPKGYKASYKRGDYETTITNKHSKHPITGDSSQVMLWIMMMLASMAGLGFSIYEKKRTR